MDLHSSALAVDVDEMHSWVGVAVEGRLLVAFEGRLLVVIEEWLFVAIEGRLLVAVEE